MRPEPPIILNDSVCFGRGRNCYPFFRDNADMLIVSSYIAGSGSVNNLIPFYFQVLICPVGCGRRISPKNSSDLWDISAGFNEDIIYKFIALVVALFELIDFCLF